LPVPELEEYGLLPPGIHECTIDEIKEKFCYNSSTTRIPLWKNFIAFIEWVTKMNIFDIIYFDGSYTTDKIDPKDIDCVLILPDKLTDEQRKNIDVKIFDRKIIKNLYNIHLYSSNKEIELYQTIRLEDALARDIDQNTRKGLLMIKLK